MENKDKTKKQLLVGEEILEAIGDAISIQDTNFKILYQNKKGKEIIGDHVGEYCYEAYEQNKSICDGCALAITFKDGKIHTTERIVPIDKRIEYFEIIASPLRDSTGKIIAGVEVVRNITERKRMEEVLRQSEEKFRLSIENAKDAIFWGDTETGLIIKCNEAAEALLEKKREEMIGYP